MLCLITNNYCYFDGGDLTICDCVVSDVVARRERKIEEQGGVCCWFRNGKLGIRCFGQFLHGYCETEEHEEHGSCRGHKHNSTGESADSNGSGRGGKKSPAVVGYVDSCLGIVACVSHHVEQGALVAARRLAGF